MAPISRADFARVELRVGRVLRADPFPEAHKPARILQIDFGEEIGVKKSSAQLTDLYDCQDLVGRLVVAVTNLAPRQIGPIVSECLVTGFHDAQGRVVLCVPDGEAPPGSRLS